MRLTARLILAMAMLHADDPPARRLSMSPGIPCKKVNGFGDYEPLEEVALTKDDKLLVYYEPSGFATTKVGDEYQVHLVQDGRVRRRGQKPVVLSKDRLLDYKGKSPTVPERIYLANTIALKSLPPGEYDLEIILRDELAKGPPASQIIKFRVKAAEPKP